MRPDEISRYHFELELVARGAFRIAGVDEAGRGPLAGPVVAAAVVLPQEWMVGGLPAGLRGLNDSKQLSPAQRETFFSILLTLPSGCRGVGVVEADEIDRLNILRASHAAMLLALGQLEPGPDHVLVDGLEVSVIRWPQTALVKGDARSYSIAAASVLAKVTRDHLMLAHHRSWPLYGFAAHKGYATDEHRRTLFAYGPCPIHRRSFAPVAKCQGELFFE